MSESSIEALWAQIEASASAERRGTLLRSPAPPEAVESLRALPLELPVALLRSLELHDGEDESDQGLLFPGLARLLSAEEIVQRFVENLQVDSEYPDELGLDENDEPEPRVAFGPVVPQRIAGQRVPFMCSYDHTWSLDFAPGKGGRVGQVIRCSDDGGVWLVCAESYQHFLLHFASALARGEVEDQQGDIETTEEVELLAWPSSLSDLACALVKSRHEQIYRGRP